MKRLIILIMLMAAMSLFSTTYYVKTAADGGDNAAAGTSLSVAWATNQYAYDTMASTDTVYTSAGSYIEADGAWGLYFDAAKDVRFIGSGTVTVTTAGANGVFRTNGTGTIYVEGFIFDAEGGTTNIALYYAGSNTTYNNCTFKSGDVNIISNAANSKNILFDDCTFLDETGSLSGGYIYLSGATQTGVSTEFNNSTFTFNTDGTTGYPFYFLGISDSEEWNVVIDSCTINAKFASGLIRNRTLGCNISITNSSITVNKDNTTGIIFNDPENGTQDLDFTFNDNVLTSAYDSVNGWLAFPEDTILVDLSIQDNTITLTDELSATPFNSFIIRSIGNANSVISGNTITSSSAGETQTIVLTASEVDCGACIIEDNTIYTRSIAGHIIQIGLETPDMTSEATYLADINNFDDSKIIGNKIYGAWYYDETLPKGSPTHGIFVAWQKNVEVSHNLVWGAGFNFASKGNSTYTTAGFHNNVSINGIFGMTCLGTRGINFHNNTIIYTLDDLASSVGLRVENYYAKTYVDSPYCNNSNFENNVIYATPSLASGESFQIIRVKTSIEDSVGTFDYNSLYGSAGSGNLYYGYDSDTSTTYTYAELNSSLGWNANGINLDPLFTDYYKPISTSPTINVGVDLGAEYRMQITPHSTFPNPTPRPQDSQWDMGACSYGYPVIWRK